MITVNLRPGKRRKSSGSSFNFKGLLDSFRDLGTKVKDPLLLGAVAGWVCVLGFLGFVYLNNVRQLYTLEPRLEQARSENRRFKTFLADKRRQEKIRDSLLAQITVIRERGWRSLHLAPSARRDHQGAAGLHLAGGYGYHRPPARAAAPRRPQTQGGLRLRPTRMPPALVFQLNGRTIDIQAYTRFLRQLEASPWIEDVTPVSAQTVVEAGAAGHRVQHPGHVRLGGLGLHPYCSLQPVGEVR